jgi:hypothetical protein
MANEIHTREQRLKQQIQQLRIKIDRKTLYNRPHPLTGDNCGF